MTAVPPVNDANRCSYPTRRPMTWRTRSSTDDDDALLLAIKNRHDCPWNESEQLKK